VAKVQIGLQEIVRGARMVSTIPTMMCSNFALCRQGQKV